MKRGGPVIIIIQYSDREREREKGCVRVGHGLNFDLKEPRGQLRDSPPFSQSRLFPRLHLLFVNSFPLNNPPPHHHHHHRHQLIWEYLTYSTIKRAATRQLRLLLRVGDFLFFISSLCFVFVSFNVFFITSLRYRFSLSLFFPYLPLPLPLPPCTSSP
ncbi:hypothetical protein F5X96DRAFT_133228 [Biscogniauxia mediterranea]|nr:hypothetical protein F5X96DRAFT_133228 [Biscogniauxia mediterranea]